MDPYIRAQVIESLVRVVDQVEESTSDFMLLQVACRLLCLDGVQALDPKIREIADELMGINHAIENIR